MRTAVLLIWTYGTLATASPLRAQQLTRPSLSRTESRSARPFIPDVDGDRRSIQPIQPAADRCAIQQLSSAVVVGLLGAFLGHRVSTLWDRGSSEAGVTGAAVGGLLGAAVGWRWATSRCENQGIAPYSHRKVSINVAPAQPLASTPAPPTIVGTTSRCCLE